MKDIDNARYPSTLLRILSIEGLSTSGVASPPDILFLFVVSDNRTKIFHCESKHLL
jgi:hypothetical protein